MKITLFGTQPYDKESFERIRDAYGFNICYHRSHLNANNVALARGSDAVCIFVNDTADAETIRQLADLNVKLIALRCAGFNNVDLNAAARYGIPVVRVPAYSPHAVAEHAVALMLALNRKVHRAYWRTRDGNFSLHGLLGFDMYGKTAGIVGTGKIARELIRILKGFGMTVVAYDPYPDRRYAAEADAPALPFEPGDLAVEYDGTYDWTLVFERAVELILEEQRWVMTKLEGMSRRRDRLRAIIDADHRPDASAESVRFSLKPRKVLLFHRETERRVRFAAQ